MPGPAPLAHRALQDRERVGLRWRKRRRPVVAGEIDRPPPSRLGGRSPAAAPAARALTWRGAAALMPALPPTPPAPPAARRARAPCSAPSLAARSRPDRWMYCRVVARFRWPAKPAISCSSQSGPRQIGEAQVPQRVRAEPRHPRADRERPDDLGPRPEGDGLRPVASRLGEEEQPARRAESAPVDQIGAAGASPSPPSRAPRGPADSSWSRRAPGACDTRGPDRPSAGCTAPPGGARRRRRARA